jgi:hypothetical protein
LEEYQASKEHHRNALCRFLIGLGERLIISRVTSSYMFPYKEDLFRFDFQVDGEDEYMCRRIGYGIAMGLITPPEEGEGCGKESMNKYK